VVKFAERAVFGQHTAANGRGKAAGRLSRAAAYVRQRRHQAAGIKLAGVGGDQRHAESGLRRASRAAVPRAILWSGVPFTLIILSSPRSGMP
jgi:hypothetical protein